MTIPPANANPYFETDASGWTATGGSAVRSTAQAHEGVASLLLTPTGSASIASVECTPVVGVLPGSQWRADVWVRCAVSRSISLQINWYTSAGVYINSTVPVPATPGVGVWTALTTTQLVPSTAGRASVNVFMGSTPTSGSLLHVDEAMIRPAGLLTATPEPGNNPPRIRLDLEYIGATEATIVRSDPDGQQIPVRLADPATLDGSNQWVGYDYESWFGEPTSYAATADAPVISGTVTLDVPDIWLRHPGVPDLSLPIDFQGEGEPTRTVTRSVQQPLGRATPIVVTDGRRRARNGQITIRTATDAEHEALLALLDDTTPLLLDVPTAVPFGPKVRHVWLSIGDLTERRRQVDYAPDPNRVWSAPYDEVGRPAGGIQAQRTYATVLAESATYQDVLTRYATYTELLTGV